MPWQIDFLSGAQYHHSMGRQIEEHATIQKLSDIGDNSSRSTLAVSPDRAADNERSCDLETDCPKF
jgi:hypothetical protein